MLIDNQPNRPIVQFVTGGFSGCRAYRASFPSLVFNWSEGCNVHVIETPFALLDHSILCQTKAIMLKSVSGKGGLELVKQMCAIRNKYGIKLVADYDDQCLSYQGCLGVDFNPYANNRNIEEEDAAIKEILPLMDTVIVTNEFFQNHLKNSLGIDNVVVIPNSVPRYLWSKPRRTPINSRIDKPTLLLSRCPLHSMAPHKDDKGNDVPGNPGDWASGQFAEWIIHSVERGRLNVIQLGGPNWMLEPIQNKITIYPWLPPLRYPSFVSRLDADFTLAPLADLPFNKFKSDLALIEAGVCSQVPLASIIPDGPYNKWHKDCLFEQGVTEQEINERIDMLCQPENYNRVINWQWDKLVVDGRITESDACMNRYMTALLGGPRNQVSFDLV